MSSNNHSFTITDERLEWERTDPWKALEAPEEPGDGDRDGGGETIVKSSERRRTMMIAGPGALAGGLMGALAATVITLSSSSGSASPRPPVHPAPAHRKSSAVVLGPAVPAPRSHSKVAKKKSHLNAAKKKTHLKVTEKAHKAKAPRKQAQPASTKHIRHPPRKHDSTPAHRNHRHSR